MARGDTRVGKSSRVKKLQTARSIWAMGAGAFASPGVALVFCVVVRCLFRVGVVLQNPIFRLLWPLFPLLSFLFFSAQVRSRTKKKKKKRTKPLLEVEPQQSLASGCSRFIFGGTAPRVKSTAAAGRAIGPMCGGYPFGLPRMVESIAAPYSSFISHLGLSVLVIVLS